MSTQPLPFPGQDVGIGFDGLRLFYNDQAGTNQLIGFETTDPPSQVTSVTVTTTHLATPPNLTREIDLDAMAFDITRNTLWAVEHNTENIYMVDRVTGVATFAFSATGKCIRCIGSFKDGLAFDAGAPGPADDALWWSYDVDYGVYKLSIPTGLEVDFFDVRGPDGTAGTADDIHPDLNNCGNSGIAVGGQLLYLGTNGCNSIVRVNKVTKAFVDVLGNLSSRPEDMECDPLTFAPREVMWVREFEDPDNVIALEIEPLSCGLGGAPPEPPACPPEDDDDGDGFEDDDDNDGVNNNNELLLGLVLNDADSDDDGVVDGNDDDNGNGEDDEDEDDDDQCPDPDSDGDGEDDEDEDDDD